MTDREKLVGIMGELPTVFCDSCGEDYLQNKILWLADHLLANGVTVNNWRDAKTDPPELPDKDFCHVDVLAAFSQYEKGQPMRYERVMIRRDRAERWVYSNGMLSDTPERWMPLPEASKEEIK